MTNARRLTVRRYKDRGDGLDTLLKSVQKCTAF